MATLTSVTRPVPNRLMILALIKLDTTVPQETMMEITPAKDKGAERVTCIAGHAEPNKESGSPKLMKAM